jgi:putative protein-disulfide isomerase
MEIPNPMEVKRKAVRSNKKEAPQTEQLEIVYYTDPLCCWSWAFEPQWRRFLFEFKGRIKYRFCMAGLLPSWDNYNDSLNSVTRPLQMGPVWMHAKQLSGMPFEQNIWMQDPPSSSYPACIAVKAAALQSQQFEALFLRQLREAVMMRAENIARRPVIMAVAEKIAKIEEKFSLEQFLEDFESDTVIELFRKDIQEVKYNNINRFPSLVVRNQVNKAILISGYRPYSNLIDAIKQLSAIQETETIDKSEYQKYWQSLTQRELQETDIRV